MAKIIIGAPSLDGKGAKEQVTKAFGKTKFPGQFLFTNLVWFAQSYPEIQLHVKGSGHGDEVSAVREIKDFDTLVRASSSMETIAKLNDSAQFIEISDEIIDPAAEAEEEQSKAPEEIIIEAPEAEVPVVETPVVAEVQSEQPVETPVVEGATPDSAEEGADSTKKAQKAAK